MTKSLRCQGKSDHSDRVGHLQLLKAGTRVDHSQALARLIRDFHSQAGSTRIQQGKKLKKKLLVFSAPASINPDSALSININEYKQHPDSVACGCTLHCSIRGEKFGSEMPHVKRRLARSSTHN